MDTADRVSITALVVSLVALIIAVLQALQQYFATADGYRNCAKSVIGPWHRTRRRRFVPSEFRFETVYEAPLIRLLTQDEVILLTKGEAALLTQKEVKLLEADGVELQKPSYSEDGLHLLNPPEAEFHRAWDVSRWRTRWARWVLFLCFWVTDEETYRIKATRGLDIVRDTVHPPVGERIGGWKRARQWAGDNWKRWMSKNRTDGLHDEETMTSNSRDEIGSNSKVVSRKTEHQHFVPAENEASLVSWIPLMRELHRTYHLYWPQNCRACFEHRDTRADPPPEMASKDWSSPTDRGPLRSDPVIIQRTIYWDLLGSLITRPVAFTTVGDIIIFAIRMGMHWRTIEPQTGTGMSASGNGYSLSATPGNGGGLILTFTAAGSHSQIPGLIPSRDADKLLFGILPGDENLVKRDFNVIGPATERAKQRRHRSEKGHHQHHEENGSSSLDEMRRRHDDIFEELSKASHDSDAENEDEGRYEIHGMAVRADMLKLLCRFLPLQGSSLTKIRFAGWRGQRGYSQLHFWEFRLVLFLELSKIAERNNHQTVLNELKYRLNTLRSDYRDDFYNVKFTTAGHKSTVDKPKICALVEQCRETYNYCTRALQNLGWDEMVAEDITRYTQLVVVHCQIAMDAADQGDKKYNDNKKNPKDEQEEWKEEFQKAAGAADLPSAQLKVASSKTYFRAKMVVKNTSKLGELLRGKSVEVTEEEAKVAWWLMMVRGIAWDMSCYREAWPEDSAIVYPAFFGDQTPVMLA